MANKWNAFVLSLLCLMPAAAKASETHDSTDKWKLIWSDEFDGEGIPDQSKWYFETGGHGWGNGEEEFYTARAENARMENGKLLIQAKKEDFENRKVTSARINSKQSWTYGRFEVRAKMPTGVGTWPAIWFLPVKQNYGDRYWPDNGEIDLLESVGRDQNRNFFSAHTAYYNWFAGNGQHTSTVVVPNADQEFHIYALEWYPDRLDFFIDNVKHMSVKRDESPDWKKWPFDRPFHLVVNLAIGGGFAGEIDPAIFPATMAVDYIRVYQQVAD